MPYANWFQRAGALLIDLLAAGAPYVACTMAANLFVDDFGYSTGPSMALVGIGYALFLAVMIWNRWMTGGRTGQTWGRRLLGIHLVGAGTGEPVGTGLAFARDVCHLADSVLCYLGWLWPLWDGRRQTFADKIVRTVVVAAAVPDDAVPATPGRSGQVG